LRRSPSEQPLYFEAYASVFIVSARTGRLVRWERPSFQAPSPEEAFKRLLAELESRDVQGRYLAALRSAQEAERAEREQSLVQSVPMIEEAPEESSPAATGLRLPQPFRRLRPAYTVEAARAEAEATVDALVDLNTEGEVTRIEVVRWAGFGLDEATVSTIRQMHFRPATREGVSVPLRVLLRYNFRKPVKEGKR
jgi:TonB family protein